MPLHTASRRPCENLKRQTEGERKTKRRTEAGRDSDLTKLTHFPISKLFIGVLVVERALTCEPARRSLLAVIIFNLIHCLGCVTFSGLGVNVFAPLCGIVWKRNSESVMQISTTLEWNFESRFQWNLCSAAYANNPPSLGIILREDALYLCVSDLYWTSVAELHVFVLLRISREMQHQIIRHHL